VFGRFSVLISYLWLRLNEGGDLMNEEYAEVKKACPLGSRNGLPRNVQIGDAVVGGDKPIIIAGPCAVEDREQIISTALVVKAAGAAGLRGGIFKPRSSPYSFQGLAKEGLEFLHEAKETTGLFVVIEVMNPEDMELAFDVADLFQIGARNMQNFSLLKKLGKQSKPVLLKRGPSATVLEWLQAAEYMLVEGNQNIILCERGIRTFETFTRNTIDINGVALAKLLSGLPVLVDPSHGTGRRDLVLPIAKAALAVGADGLMIEVHPTPEKALSDGNQSLNFSEFRACMKALGVFLPKRSRPSASQPSFPEARRVEELLKAGYRWIPVTKKVSADLETPVSVFLKSTFGARRFLLESVAAGEQPGRYSYIGWDPLATYTANDLGVFRESNGTTEKLGGDDVLMMIKEEFAGMRVAPCSEILLFYGGCVGYLGYDYVRRIENLPFDKPNTLDLPEALWMIPRRLAVFDHVSQQITFVYLLQAGEDLEKAQACLEEMALNLTKDIPASSKSILTDEQVRSSFSHKDYEQAVKEGLEAIRAGDIFQVVLSQRLSRCYGGEPLALYRVLRRMNPSPYLFFIQHESFALIGSSPESMVRLEDGEIQLCPIAGTRPRSHIKQEDQDRELELLSDPKERAEHIMLVDLGRNDLGKVAKFGTVRVDDLMHVERYSHVMHIVSSIRAKLRKGKDGFDLLRATFPAGTVSGAPKIRAMEIIEQLEPVRRGAYAGAVGYIGFNGNLDTGIIIRTIILKDGWTHIQAGAGIVVDSDPGREFEETMYKAEALLKAVSLAEEEGLV
jgi:anthranilate synthase component 1